MRWCFLNGSSLRSRCLQALCNYLYSCYSNFARDNYLDI